MSLIFLHFLITLIITAAVFLLYACHSHLICLPGKDKKALKSECTFNVATLMRFLLIPSILSVSLILLPLSLLENAQEKAPVSIEQAVVQEAQQETAAEEELLQNTGSGSVVFNTLVHIAQLISMEITSEDVWALYAGISGSSSNIPAQPSSLEIFWISLVLAAAPLMTLITAASFFRLPRFWAAMLFSAPFGRPFIVFSDLNDRSRKYAAILKSPPAEPGAGPSGRWQRPYIIFCCDENTADEAVETGRALIMKRSITNLHIIGKQRFHFYLMSDSESTVVEQANILQSKYQQKGSRIYCVSISNDLVSEHAVDKINKLLTFKKDGDCKCFGVDVIDEKTRVVYQDLYTNPLITEEFLDAVNQSNSGNNLPNATKTIRVLVLGIGRVGEVVARTLMWYCQLPDYKLEITVADMVARNNIEHRIFRHNADYQKLKNLDIFKDRVTLNILENIDLMTGDLEKVLTLGKAEATQNETTPEDHKTQPAPYHAIYVCLGDDNRNYQAALRVRRHYLRHPMPWGFPEIRTVIWDDTITDLVKDSVMLKGSALSAGQDKYTHYSLMLEQPGEKNTQKRYNEKCRVNLLGSLQETLVNIETLKKDAFRYHTYYCNEQLSEEEQQALFDNEELLLKEKSRLTKEESQLLAKKKELFDAAHPGYQKSSKSDVRSNYAVALHGKAKYNWFLHNGSKKDEALFDLLAKTEHIRWCIFKLTEGDMPVEDDHIAQYLCRNRKGRDDDSLRGYHVCLVLYSKKEAWSQRLPSFASDQKLDAHWQHTKECTGEAAAFEDFWKGFWQSQLKKDKQLARFSIELELSRKSQTASAAENG